MTETIICCNYTSRAHSKIHSVIRTVNTTITNWWHTWLLSPIPASHHPAPKLELRPWFLLTESKGVSTRTSWGAVAVHYWSLGLLRGWSCRPWSGHHTCCIRTILQALRNGTVMAEYSTSICWCDSWRKKLMCSSSVRIFHLLLICIRCTKYDTMREDRPILHQSSNSVKWVPTMYADVT